MFLKYTTRLCVYLLISVIIFVCMLQFIFPVNFTYKNKITTKNTMNVLQKSSTAEESALANKGLTDGSSKGSITLKANIHIVPTSGLKSKLEMKANTNNLSPEDRFYRKRKHVVNKYIYNFTILPKKKFCTNSTSVLVLINSKGDYIEKRMAIRKTWGSVANTASPKWPDERNKIDKEIALIFVTSIQRNTKLNTLLSREAEEFGDMMQGNFIDDYRNLTLKSLLGLKYMIENCNTAPYVVKGDDDIFINIPFLLHTLFVSKLLPPRSIMGNLFSTSPVLRDNGTWSLTMKEFPFTSFPPYELGYMYVMTKNIVSELYETSNYVPWIYIDDVYITGILAKVIKARHCKSSRALFKYFYSERMQSCHIILNKHISFNPCHPKDMYSLWNGLNSTCS